jgi:hypothetical protein
MEARKCKKPTVPYPKDVPVKTDAESLAYSVSFTRDLKEGFGKIEGRTKRGELAGLGSANGQV